jgi:drug/metabolite transporter (DMT)-like permease
LLGRVRAGRAIPAELRGILITLLAMFLFGLMDAGSKYLATRYPAAQIIWLRYVFTIPMLLAAMAPRGIGRYVRSQRPGLQLLRGLILVVEIGLAVWTFGQLPLADVHAVLALTPLVVTALSVPMLREPVGPRRWAAVAVGFVGVLIVLRPGLSVLHPAALVALLCVFLYSLYQILTKMVGPADAAETSLLWQLVAGAVLASLAVPFVWQPVALEHWPMLVVVAVLGGLGHYLMIRAFQLAPAVVIQPFSYVLLVWAVVIGYLGFGDVPDIWTLVGALVIVGAGSYAAVREHRRGRSA